MNDLLWIAQQRVQLEPHNLEVWINYANLLEQLLGFKNLQTFSDTEWHQEIRQQKQFLEEAIRYRGGLKPENWVLRLKKGDTIWLIKEHRHATITVPWRPYNLDSSDRTGTIGLEDREQFVTWWITPTGNGFDGRPLIQKNYQDRQYDG